MYGWFEPGGGVDKFFINTKMIDVLLRTNSMSNTLVFGNTRTTATGVPIPGTAAVYISHNALGVQRIPDPQFSLDVANPARFDTSINCGNVTVTSKNLTIGPTIMTDDGEISSPLVVCNNLLTPKTTLTGMVVRACSFNTNNTINLTLMPSPMLKAIVPNLYVQISGITFYIVSTPLTNEFVLQYYFASQKTGSVPWIKNQVIDVNVLKNLNGAASNLPFNSSGIISWFTVQTYSLIANDTWSGTVSFNGSVNLTVGQYYSFGLNQTVQNIVQLTSLTLTQPGVSVIGQIVLKTIDGTYFPQSWNVSAITGTYIDDLDAAIIINALILLDVILPPSFQDPNAIMGSYTYTGQNPQGNYVYLKNTSLGNFINTVPNGNPITNITINGILDYEFFTVFKAPNGDVIGQLSNTTTPYTFTIKGNANYSLIGNPISVISITQRISNGVLTYLYQINDIVNILPLLQTFIKGYLFFCNMLSARCTIISVDVIRSSIELDANVFGVGPVKTDQIFYVVPFQQAYMTNLGVACYTTSHLAVGTQNASETLTVAGDASILGKMLINDDQINNNPFPVMFSSNLFTLGHVLKSTPTQVTIQQNTSINGTIIANDFLKYSDRRIKKNIKRANGQDDFDLIKTLAICDFDFKEGQTRQKGVIAQELEALAPHLVSERSGFVPSICKMARVTTTGSMVLPSIATVDAELKPGMRLHIKVQGHSRHVTITRVRTKRGATFIQCSEQYPVGTAIYVRGPYGLTKVINKDALFMTLISAFKHSLC